MAVRVGWLPTGTQSAEDTRAAEGFQMSSSGLLLPRSGVVPSPTQAFALTSTGSLSCSVGAGQLMVVPGATTNQGGYPVTVDASGSGLPTVSFAAGGSLARTDVIYAQVQDNAEDASGFTRGQIAVQQGTNGGGVPTTPSGTVPIWQVPVPASASSLSFATAVFVATPTVSLGGVIPWASATLAGAYIGQVRARTDRGMTTGQGPLEVWDGSNWQPAVPLALNPAGTPRGFMAAPISTASNGTATPAGGSNPGTDTLDSVLGNYVFTAVAGRRYRVMLTGLIANGSVLGDVFALRVRDSGSASTPTTASTAVIDSSWTCDAVGGPGRITLHLEDSFIASSSGTHTLAVFAQRVAGTGQYTPLSSAGNSATGLRKLVVEDAGNI